MNKIKSSLLLMVVSLALVSCNNEISCKDALETSNTMEIKEGYQYQASYRDIVESVFVINPPLNPEAENPEDYVYDLSWKISQNLSWYTFGGGLEGKQVLSINRLSDNILTLYLNRPCEDNKATSGYIKIAPNAFISRSGRTRGAYLYAYVAIGNLPGLVLKDQEKADESTTQSSIASAF